MNETLKNSLYGLFYLAAVYIGFLMFPLVPNSTFLMVGVLMTAVVCFLTWGFLKYERTSLRNLGLIWHHQWLKNTLIGALAGVVLLTLMLVVVASLTPVFFEPSVDQTWSLFLLGSVPVVFFLALMEEVIFRGYLLFKLKQAWGIRGAVYFTSIAFGLYHGLVWESLIGPAVWGLIYAWMALVSKGLILPLIFHFALNWTQTFFGMKTKYVEGMFTLKIDTNQVGLDPDLVGLILQGLLAVIGVVLVERHIRKIARKNKSF